MKTHKVFTENPRSVYLSSIPSLTSIIIIKSIFIMSPHNSTDSMLPSF